MFEVMLVVLMELVEMMLAVMLSLSFMLLLLFAAATIAIAALAFSYARFSSFLLLLLSAGDEAAAKHPERVSRRQGYLHGRRGKSRVCSGLAFVFPPVRL